MNPFVRETVDRVNDLLAQGHVGAEVKKAFQDLIAVVENIEALRNDNTGMSADKRYLQAKLNEALNQRRQAEKDLQTVKNVIAQELPQIIKDLSAEIHLVAQQGQTLGQPALQTSAERMRQQLRLFVEALTLTGPKT